MSKLTIEFELSEDAAILKDGKIMIDLGSGASLVTKAPRGLERINSVVLQVVMEVEGVLHAIEQGSAPDAGTSEDRPTLLGEESKDRPRES